MVKFKVGERVRVKKDIDDWEVFSTISFVPQMDKYRGGLVTIESVRDDGFGVYYKIKEGAWLFDEGMLSKIEEENEMIKLVYVNFNSNNDKNYLYMTPRNLNKHDEVLVESKFGSGIANCSADSFDVPYNVFEVIMSEIGLRDTQIKYVKGIMRGVELFD